MTNKTRVSDSLASTIHRLSVGVVDGVGCKYQPTFIAGKDVIKYLLPETLLNRQARSKLHENFSGLENNAHQ
jgi:hypothetical protein